MEEEAVASDNIVTEFATYEDFLDSQITPLDLYYLEVCIWISILNILMHDLCLWNFKSKASSNFILKYAWLMIDYRIQVPLSYLPVKFHLMIFLVPLAIFGIHFMSGPCML